MNKGAISIGRVIQSDRSQFVTIDIEDYDSGKKLIKVEMNLEDFAKVMTGLGTVPCDYEIKSKEEK